MINNLIEELREHLTNLANWADTINTNIVILRSEVKELREELKNERQKNNGEV